MTSAAMADQVTGMSLRILELLAPEPAGMRVSDVAAVLDVNKAIAHRLVTALTRTGYVEQDPISGRYRATFQLGALGLRQIESADTDRWAQPTLDRLARETEELVRLSVATGDRLQWVLKAQGARSSLRVDPVMGTDVVLHATASGKAWLSGLDRQRVDRILGTRELAAQTTRTTTSLPDLLAEVAVARERGYALTEEEADPGISAIAVPFFHPRGGDAVGAVSVAGPASRLDRTRLEVFRDRLQAAAIQVSSGWAARRHQTSPETPATR